MRIKRLALIGLFGAVAVGGAVTPAAAANASSATARPASDQTCYFVGDGVRLRANHTTSSTVLGLAYRSHSCLLHSIWYDPSGGVWEYVTDRTTGVTGWAWNYVAW